MPQISREACAKSSVENRSDLAEKTREVRAAHGKIMEKLEKHGPVIGKKVGQL